MKKLSALVLLAVGTLAGCSETSNVNNANLRGTNTNTGYVTNATQTPMATPSSMNNNISNMNSNKNSNNTSNLNTHSNRP